MISIPRVKEPSDFHSTVRIKGNEWLANNTVKRPTDLWSPYRSVLEEGFKSLCAYSAMEIPYGGTVDHFLSCKYYRHLSYEWSNYRYCLGSINSRKRNYDSEILDPHEVEDDWFEVTIPGYLLKPTSQLPENLKTKANKTIQVLGLNKQEIINFRLKQYRRFLLGQVTLDYLFDVAPLIAKAIIKGNHQQDITPN